MKQTEEFTLSVLRVHLSVTIVHLSFSNDAMSPSLIPAKVYIALHYWFAYEAIRGVVKNECSQEDQNLLLNLGLTKISSLKSNVYDEPPLVTCSQDIMQQSSVGQFTVLFL